MHVLRILSGQEVRSTYIMNETCVDVLLTTLVKISGDKTLRDFTRLKKETQFVKLTKGINKQKYCK